MLLLIMLRRMEFGDLIIALGILFRVLQLTRFAVNHKVSESDNPLPEHVLGASIELGTQLIEDA